jgi:hypothetical protein
LVELSTIRDLVAIFGVVAGFSYYVLTVRNAKKSQDERIYCSKESTPSPLNGTKDGKET